MLVLSRRPEEKVFVNDDIEIVVLGIQNGRVRLGFNAPKEHIILRGEVRDQLTDRENNQVIEMRS